MGVSIARTAELWYHSIGADEGNLDRLESIILRHSPKTPEEAAAMLDVVAANVAGGQRCDGLDIRAINAVASWLRSE